MNIVEKNIIEYYDNRYGKDLHSRLDKLLEEMFELTEEIHKKGELDFDKIKKEIGDVVSICIHILNILGSDIDNVLIDTLVKNKIREIIPNYDRNDRK